MTDTSANQPEQKHVLATGDVVRVKTLFTTSDDSNPPERQTSFAPGCLITLGAHHGGNYNDWEIEEAKLPDLSPITVNGLYLKDAELAHCEWVPPTTPAGQADPGAAS